MPRKPASGKGESKNITRLNQRYKATLEGPKFSRLTISMAKETRSELQALAGMLDTTESALVTIALHRSFRMFERIGTPLAHREKVAEQ
jgi:hypothetical protein